MLHSIATVALYKAQIYSCHYSLGPLLIIPVKEERKRERERKKGRKEGAREGRKKERKKNTTQGISSLEPNL